jgi:hypothetical protein
MDLILPGNPLFDLTLDTAIRPDASHYLNPSTGGLYMIKSADGLMRPATLEELNDYLYGGEYDEVYEDDDNCEFFD